MAIDYPYVHQVANVRVFSDISPTFSEEHAEHLSRVWDFFDALYAENRGAHVDAYYTSDSTVFKKVVPHCPTIFIPGARALTACYLDYPRWFIIPYQIPDLGTQLHEIGHDFALRDMAGLGSRHSPGSRKGLRCTSRAVRSTARSESQAALQYCTDLFQRHDQQDRLHTPRSSCSVSTKADFLADNLLHLLAVVHAIRLPGAP